MGSSSVQIWVSKLPAFVGMLALACVIAFSVAPGVAHAKFNDAATSFPATQDLGAYEAPIDGSQLPDGAYSVTARTTSRMCILYTNPQDAEARDSKERAVILVENGSMTAVFYISKAYNYLYMGTQEEAAAATDADGTDASAYIAGDPPDGYVPHLFAIPVPSLNTPMTVSTYSGGDHGNEQGRWYTRQMVFAMTHAELEANIIGGQEQETPDDQSGNGAGAGGAGEAQAELTTDNLTSTNAGESGGTGGTNEPANEPAPANDSVQQAPVANPTSMHGILMTATPLEVSLPVSEDILVEVEKDKGFVWTPQLVMAIAAAVFLVVGVAARSIAFRRGMQNPVRISVKTDKE